jgi:hypothetical protein
MVAIDNESLNVYVFSFLLLLLCLPLVVNANRMANEVIEDEKEFENKILER